MASENPTIMPNIITMIVVFSWVENTVLFQNFGEICLKLEWKNKDVLTSSNTDLQ